MSYNLDTSSKHPIRLWTQGVPVEEEAIKQLRNLANLPFIHSHVAVMPDVHVGVGSTVGSVIATNKAIIPASVGVDIGCGCGAVKLDGITASDLPESLTKLRAEIEHAIPVGFDVHNEADPGLDKLNWQSFIQWIDDKHTILNSRRKDPLAKIIGKQLGTLGGGNHFIELCLDKEDNVWVMLHSGSRGIGNLIGSYFTEQAKEYVQKQGIELKDKNLAHLDEGTQLFDDYINGMSWCQYYASKNREEMLRRVMIVLRRNLPPFQLTSKAINCHHNYTNKEFHFGDDVWVTRKGAVYAGKDALGIIPGSMGARSFIVRGKGNPDSFCSCSHGAGRVMSRTAAKKSFTIEDHIKATEGIECKKDISVLDETPMAYKSIDSVMAAQTDLVEVVAELRQVLCVKG